MDPSTCCMVPSISGDLTSGSLIVHRYSRIRFSFGCCLSNWSRADRYSLYETHLASCEGEIVEVVALLIPVSKQISKHLDCQHV